MTRLAPCTGFATIALSLLLSACERKPDPTPDPALTASPDVPAAEPSRPAAIASAVAGAQVLSLEGLGALRIGQPLPSGGSWAERGAQASDSCRIASSPQYPHVYAILEGGKVRRITVSEGSAVRTIEGIGPRSTRAEVNSAFPGFRETPHHYVEGGKDLIAPNAASGDPAVRFELSPEGRVTEMHIGTMPVLGYVEACS